MATPSGDYTTLVPVTGEAVALDLRLAQLPSRLLALALDLVVQLVALGLVVWFTAAVASRLDPAAATAISLVSVVAVIVGLPTLAETLGRGRSLGKLAAGLRVVRDDGGPVRFRHSFVRALFMIVDLWLSSGAVGLISVLVSSRSKRVGDHFAGTVVIRERVPAAGRPDQLAYVMPTGLGGWAATLDLARLPDVTVLQARQLLLRSPTLAPAVRASMGQSLAAEVSSYVTPAAPLGTPPETYLLAVLAERMRRASQSPEPEPFPRSTQRLADTAPSSAGPGTPRHDRDAGPFAAPS